MNKEELRLKNIAHAKKRFRKAKFKESDLRDVMRKICDDQIDKHPIIWQKTINLIYNYVAAKELLAEINQQRIKELSKDLGNQLNVF